MRTRIKSIVIFAIAIFTCLSCDKDSGIEFSPTSIKFSGEGGEAVMIISGQWSGPVEFNGIYSIGKNHQFEAEEEVVEIDGRSYILSVTNDWISVVVERDPSEYQRETHRYYISATPNNSGADRECQLSFNSGNRYWRYKVKQSK